MPQVLRDRRDATKLKGRSLRTRPKGEQTSQPTRPSQSTYADPSVCCVQLAGENEVKAQVKLRFQNSNSERMVVTRNLQVTAKKTGLSMKTLEGILAKDENTESNRKVDKGLPSSLSAFDILRLTQTSF